MSRAFATVVSFAWALWFGGMVMLLAAVLRLFAVFEQDRETFGRAAGAMFRLFEAYQLVLAAVALVATVAWRAFGAGRLKTALFVLFALATLAAAGATTLVTPKVEAMRQQGLTGTPEFKRMHGLSSAVYMAGAAALLLAGFVLPAAIRDDSKARRDVADPHVTSGNGDGDGNGIATHPAAPVATSHAIARS